MSDTKTPITKVTNSQVVYGKETTDMTCPVCIKEVDHLVGEDTKDGGVMGCEACWKAPQHPISMSTEDMDSGIISKI